MYDTIAKNFENKVVNLMDMWNKQTLQIYHKLKQMINPFGFHKKNSIQLHINYSQFLKLEISDNTSLIKKQLLLEDSGVSLTIWFFLCEKNAAQTIKESC